MFCDLGGRIAEAETARPMQPRLLIAVACALLAGWLAPVAGRAQTTTTLAPTADVWTRQNQATQTNNTTTLTLEPTKRQTLIQFDISSVPAFHNAIISAKLRLYVTQASTDGGTIHAYRTTAAWSETTATWTNMSANYDATSQGTGVPSTLNQYVELDVTNLVRSWRSGTANYGMTLMTVGGASTTSYNSREAADAAARPQLVIVSTGDPSYTISKLTQVVSDPANGTTQPKRMPGAVIEHLVTVSSTNPNVSDSNSVALAEVLPTQTSLYVGDIGAPGGGPVSFSNGSPSSGLTYTYVSLASGTDDLSFSSNGGVSFTYVPVPDANGYDSTVTHLRIAPKGIFAGATSGNPSFSYQFRVKNK